MSIFYLISMISLFVTFLFFQKSKKKLEIITHIVLNFVLLIVYNVSLTYVFTLVDIPINVFTYSLVALLISGYFLLNIKNHKQEFYFDKNIGFGIGVIVIVCILISMKNFKWDFSLAYETTDPNVHYMMAYAFSLDDSLLSKPDVIYPIYGALNGMTISYVNIGLLFKGLNSYVSEIDYYKIFIIYDSFMYVLATSVFFISIKNFIKDKSRLIISLIITMFFSLGYPLSNLLFGFRYLGDAVILINVILIFFSWLEHNYIKSKKEKILFIVILTMLNFGVFMGYYLFIPVVYSAEFLFLIYYFWKKKRLFNKQVVMMLLFVLIVPTILGVIFYFTPIMQKNIPVITNQNQGLIRGLLSTIQMEGYIYRDLYSNFIFLVPLILYYVFKCIKNKKITFPLMFGVILVLFILAIFLLGMYGYASSYYYFKNYFVLWMLFYYVIFISINDIMESEQGKTLIHTSIITVLALFMIFYFHIDGKISEANGLFNVDHKSVKYLDIYATNRVYMGHENALNSDDIKAITYFKTHYLSKYKEFDYIPTIGNTQQRLWTFCLTRMNPNKTNDNSFGPFYEDSFSLDEILDSSHNILISYNKLKNKEVTKIKEKNWKVVFENNGSFIAVRNVAN